MQGEGDVVGCVARQADSLELDGSLSDGADFHQLSFDDLRISHRTSSMPHGGIVGTLIFILGTCPEYDVAQAHSVRQRPQILLSESSRRTPRSSRRRGVPAYAHAL